MDPHDEEFDPSAYAAIIDSDTDLARTLGQRRAPAIFGNGHALAGRDLNSNQIRAQILSEMNAVEDLLESGAAASMAYSLRVRENVGPARREPDNQRRTGRDRGAERERHAQRANGDTEPRRREAAQPPSGDIERLRVPIGDSFSMGPDDALVTIVEFSDFHCPFSGRAAPTVAQIREQYGDQVRTVFKHNPLPMHPNAPLASSASLAAGAQGKFWEMHDLIFENQRRQTREDIESFAEQLGLDMDQFRDALDSGRFSDQIDREMAEGRRLGVTGTPSWLVNGELVVGAVPFSRFQPIIDRALAD